MRSSAFLLAACLLATTAGAQTAAPEAMFTRIAPPPSPAGEIALYEGPIPGAVTSPPAEVWDRMTGITVLRNVTRPTLTPFLPPPGKATGAAVVVLPGGGFQMLGLDVEGWSVARWLADHGVAAFVLKYRTAPTPPDEAALLPSLMRSMGGLMADPEKAMAPLAGPAEADTVQALKRVRAGAMIWKIDPARVGLVGFSAGALAARDVALSLDPADRPAFLGYLYGPMREVTVPAGAPPMFAGLALDDPLMGRQGFGIVDGWRKAHRPVEFHAYEKGGHGFGGGKPGTTTTLVLPELLAWLQMGGFLDKGHR